MKKYLFYAPFPLLEQMLGKRCRYSWHVKNEQKTHFKPRTVKQNVQKSFPVSLAKKYIGFFLARNDHRHSLLSQN